MVPPRTLDENFYNNHLETTDGRSLCPAVSPFVCPVTVLGVDSERKARKRDVHVLQKWNIYMKQKKNRKRKLKKAKKEETNDNSDRKFSRAQLRNCAAVNIKRTIRWVANGHGRKGGVCGWVAGVRCRGLPMTKSPEASVARATGESSF